MATRRIPIARPAVGDEEWQALREPLLDGWLTQGPRVSAFERAFAARHAVDHAIAATSGTTALHLALAGLGIGPGHEVIVPSFTWVATANAVIYCGARPVLVDIDPETFNLSPAAVAAAVGPATRAVIAVHLFGLCADMNAIGAVAPGIPVIEDAACAAGASYQTRPAGSIGDAGVFSFHPRKTMTTGEGGMITTDDAALAGRIAALRNHGAGTASAPHQLPPFDQLGFNYRMTDLQAAVGLVQLAKLDRMIDERAALAGIYHSALADVPWLRLPAPAPAHCRHGWQAFVCMIDPARAPAPRDELMARLAALGVDTRPGTHAIHTLAYYRDRYDHADDDLPAAAAADRFSLALPLHNHMTADDADYVASALRGL